MPAVSGNNPTPTIPMADKPSKREIKRFWNSRQIKYEPTRAIHPKKDIEVLNIYAEG